MFDWPQSWPIYLCHPIENYPTFIYKEQQQMLVVPLRLQWVMVSLAEGVTDTLKEVDPNRTFLWSPPAMYDVDKDGIPEIFWLEATDDCKFWILYKYSLVRGRLDSLFFWVPNTSCVVTGGSFSLVLGKFDESASSEIAVVIPASDSSSSLLLIDASRLVVIKRKHLQGSPYWQPRAGDLNNDGFDELVFATAFPSIESSTLWIYNSYNDTLFSIASTRLNILGLYFADIDSDNVPEVILLIPDTAKAFDYESILCSEIISPAIKLGGVLADVNGDGSDELITGRRATDGENPAISALSFTNGLIWEVDLPPDTNEFEGMGVVQNESVSFPFVWDIDGDRFPELIGAKGFSSDSGDGCMFLSLWEIPVENPHLGWPMLYHDPWNTNNYDFWPPQVGIKEDVSGRALKFLKPTPEGLLVNSPKAQLAELKVYDVAGRLVYGGKVNLKAGANLIKVPGRRVRVVSLLGERVKVVR